MTDHHVISAVIIPPVNLIMYVVGIVTRSRYSNHVKSTVE